MYNEKMYLVMKNFTIDFLYEHYLIHISEPTRQEAISYAFFCLKKK